MTGVRTSAACALLGLPLGMITFLYGVYKWTRMVNLQDKVVLITGASGGIGEACAEIFHEAGCKVILSARKVKTLEKLKERLSNKKGKQCHIPAVVAMDLEHLSLIPDKVADAIEAFGHIDILINNAGVGVRGWASETKIEVDEKVMMINYFGQLQVTKALLPHMMQRKSGHIVVVSSLQGKIGIPGRAAYSASKHALEGFFDSLRSEMSMYNITVSIISAYYVRTNLSMNAICSDGSTYNKMDKTTLKGYEPRYVASRILNCVRKKKEEYIIAPFFMHLALCLRVFAPWLFFKEINRQARQMALENSKNQ